MKRTQIERGRGSLFLGSNLSDSTALSQLLEDRKQTDRALEALSWWPVISVSHPYAQTFETKYQFDYFLGESETL